MKNLRIWFLLSAVIFAISSCTDHEGDPVADMDRQFMISAADGNLFEIKAGEIAAAKAIVDSVKSYGLHMGVDHTMATQELMSLASKKGVTLPTTLSPAKQMKIDSLNAKTGMDFDKTYMNMMVASHIETINLFEMEATKGVDPEVKSWAAGKLPTLKHHLEKAEALKNSL